MRVPGFLRFRRLIPAEHAFLDDLFGDALRRDRIVLMGSIGRRSWAPVATLIGLCTRHFEAEDVRAPVRLAEARSAAVFAHEALHVWQRQHGRRVSYEGACLQVPYMLGGASPYRYETCADPDQLLGRFLAGNIEQQGQIVQDYVFARLTGRPVSRYARLARHLRAP